MPRVLLAVALAQGLMMLVGLVKAKIVVAALGPAGFGISSTIDQTVLTVVQLGALSLPFTAMKFMARSHSQDQHAFERTFSAFLRALTIVALAAVALVASALAWVPDVFGQELTPYRGVLYIALLGAPAMILQILFVNALAAAQRTSTSAGANLVVMFVLAVAAVVGVLWFGIAGMYVTTAAAGLVMALLMLRYLRRHLGLTVGGPSVSLFSELRRSPEIVWSALLIYAAMSAYSLTMLSTRYFVLRSLGEVEAGLLQAVLSIALTASAALLPMSNLYLAPLLNRRLSMSVKVAAANEFGSLLILLLVVVALPVVLFPQLTLTVLFSSKFVTAAHVLFLFVAWQCLYQIVNIYLQLLLGLDDVRFFTLSTCIGYGCAVLLFQLLIPRVGLSGAALGLLGATVVSGLAAVMRLRKRFGSSISREVWLRAGLCLGAIAVTGLAFDVASEPTPPGIAARVIYALGVGALLWTRLSKRERMLVGTALARLRGLPAARKSPPGRTVVLSASRSGD